jgi:hypothetical protein
MCNLYINMVIITAVLSLFVCGCDQQQTETNGSAVKQIEAYGPETLDIVGLTELKVPSGNDTAKLTLFVRALDGFGSAVKTPCVLRVEMFEHVARSPSPLGKRIELWPDIDLTDVCKNNAQWRDYLRAYEFNFDVSSQLTPGHVYIIEVTCRSPMGKRMSAQYKLSYAK